MATDPDAAENRERSEVSADRVRTDAEALATALELGIITVADVIGWVDGIIAVTAHPHWSLCELALCGRAYMPDVTRRLRELSGTPDMARATALVPRLLLDRLDRDPESAVLIARALYDLAVNGDIEDRPLLEVAWTTWDYVELAREGCLPSSPEEIIAEMRARLAAAVDRSGVASPLDRLVE
jgi:hypothetical protein